MDVALRRLSKSLIRVILLAVVLVAVAVLCGRVSQWHTVRSARIETPKGVESLESVLLGEVEQTIYLRGRDRDKPVLLFVHGGPGVPEMPAARTFGLRLEELSTVHPPYPNTQALMLQRAWLSHYHGDFLADGTILKFVRALLLSPEYTIGKKLSLYGCAMNSLDQAWDDLQSINFLRDIPRLEVPVYFFTGRHDYTTPFELVEEFHETLEAPHNEIVWFENSAHMPNFEEPDRYQDMLIQKVLPETFRTEAGS